MHDIVALSYLHGHMYNVVLIDHMRKVLPDIHVIG